MRVSSPVLLLLCGFAAAGTLHAQKKQQQHRAATPPGGTTVEMAIDGTNERTFAASVESIAKTLRGTERDQFTEGLDLLQMMAPSREALLHHLDGMSPKELVRIHGEIVSRGDTDGDGVLSTAERERLRAEVAAQRREANERSAIATLRNLCSAQGQIQATGCIDGDGDGRGEYGYVAEMTGAIGLRNRSGRHGKVPIELPVLPSSYQVRDGRVVRNGYVFQVYLPAADGTPLGESGSGGMGKQAPDASEAARAWCAYAWPQVQGESGVRAFFVCEDGVVLESAQATYSTPERGPSGEAALPNGVRTLGTETGAKQRVGNDGAVWRPVK